MLGITHFISAHRCDRTAVDGNFTGADAARATNAGALEQATGFPCGVGARVKLADFVIRFALGQVALRPDGERVLSRHGDALSRRQLRAVAQDQVDVAADRDAVVDDDITRRRVPAPAQAFAGPNDGFVGDLLTDRLTHVCALGVHIGRGDLAVPGQQAFSVAGRRHLEAALFVGEQIDRAAVIPEPGGEHDGLGVVLRGIAHADGVFPGRRVRDDELAPLVGRRTLFVHELHVAALFADLIAVDLHRAGERDIRRGVHAAAAGFRGVFCDGPIGESNCTVLRVYAAALLCRCVRLDFAARQLDRAAVLTADQAHAAAGFGGLVFSEAAAGHVELSFGQIHATAVLFG